MEEEDNVDIRSIPGPRLAKMLSELLEDDETSSSENNPAPSPKPDLDRDA